MMKELEEIRKFMKEKASGKAGESWMKYVPNAGKVHGVYLSEVNKLVPKYKSCGFELVRKLWKSGYLEERILASKILGRLCKKEPDKALKLVEKFANDIDNWAVCDTLATQGTRAMAKAKKKDIFELSRRLVKSRNPWKRRFGIVLLINFSKDKSLRNEILVIIGEVENDREYYVRKAVEWLRRSMKLEEHAPAGI